ncbi:MAG TPA: hypothetical protein PLN86_16385 [Candidatus Hydrogenedentes bacterium]|nr:hypothetical protein [Candidatus Hydrogenedentota bacterium]
MQANLTDQNPPLTATNGQVNMSAVMEGMAQLQDGLRKITLAGCLTPAPRSLSNGLCLVVISVPDHNIVVMDGEEKNTFAFAIDGIPVRQGWPE